ncbi:hypothetical protein CF386_04220 [Paraphotobacterium marinum]|uniref:Translocation and assembly module TamB C-terminal domain-containing protein n=1 Tax=Paraphotobacterium marinum TaxID=1755811 RepID=A0A220VD53_9GAMM|nr:translocation/assembly module TamB domain-containing protein [Paraphotobacterium marinum]ASK78275.1 hypothetical protein CF386_04220 [Paraphotobacterium marinum]
MLKRLIITTIFLLLFLTTLTYCLLVSSAGNKLVFSIVNDFSDTLHIEYIKGNIFDGINFNSISFNNKNVQTKLSNIEAKLGFNIHTYTLSIKRLHVINTVVQNKKNSKSEDSKDTDSDFYTKLLPNINFNKVLFNQVKYITKSKVHTLNSLKFKGFLNKTKLKLEEASLNYNDIVFGINGNLDMKDSNYLVKLNVNYQIDNKEFLKANQLKSINGNFILNGSILSSFSIFSKSYIISDSNKKSIVLGKGKGNNKKFQFNLLDNNNRINLLGTLLFEKTIKYKVALVLKSLPVYFSDSNFINITGRLNLDGLLKEHSTSVNLNTKLHLYNKKQNLILNTDINNFNISDNKIINVSNIFLSVKNKNKNKKIFFVKGKLTTNHLNLIAKLDCENLKYFLPQSKGKIEGEALLSGTVNNPRAKIRLKGKGVNIFDTISFYSASLFMDTNFVNGYLKPVVHLTLKKAFYKKIGFGSVSLISSMNAKSDSFHFELLKGDTKIESFFSTKLSKKQIFFNFQTLNLTYRKNYFHLIKPFIVNYDFHKIDIGTISLRSKASKIDVYIKNLLNNNLVYKLNLQNLDVKAIDNFLPSNIKLTGKLNVGIQGNKYKNSLYIKSEGSFSLKKSGVFRKIFTWKKFNLKGGLVNNQVNLSINSKLNKIGLLKLQLNIKDIYQKKILDGYLKLNNIPLESLSHLSREITNLGAIANSDIKISGDLKTPHFEGQSNIKINRVKTTIFPFNIKNGKIDIKLNKKLININTHVQTNSGFLSIQSDLKDYFTENALLKFIVKTNNFNLNIPQYGNGLISSNINGVISKDSFDISGNINIPSGKLKIQSFPEEAITTSKDVILVDSKYKPLRKNLLSTTKKVNGLIQINIGNKFKIKGLGFKGNIFGNLKLQYKNNNLALFGQLITNGKYNQFSQNLILEKDSKVIFNGVLDNPSLFIKAYRNPEITSSDIQKVGVKVTGSLNRPQISLYSIPSKPKPEQISYLVYGHGLSNNSDNKKNANLAGLGLLISNSNGTIKSLGKQLGIKQLALTSNSQGNSSQLALSGYIFKKVQLTYGMNIDTQEPEWQIKYHINNNIYIALIQNISNSVEIVRSFNFD